VAAPVRKYEPSAALYARQPLKFRGVQYKHGEKLPDGIPPAKHRDLWFSGLADHEKYGPFDPRRKLPRVGAQPPCTPQLYDAACAVDEKKLSRRERRALRNSSPTTSQVPRMSLDGGASAKQEDSLPRPAGSEANPSASE
jgi:hypothetical protein